MSHQDMSNISKYSVGVLAVIFFSIGVTVGYILALADNDFREEALEKYMETMNEYNLMRMDDELLKAANEVYYSTLLLQVLDTNEYSTFEEQKKFAVELFLKEAQEDILLLEGYLKKAQNPYLRSTIERQIKDTKEAINKYGS